MSSPRNVTSITSSRPVIEGAGVHLKRAFGFGNTYPHDPFLLLDDFRSDDPAAYLSGFPWHPHRGIETISYILRGTVEHGDSLGNSGTIGPGDVQWMTAGSGIIHQEMPKGDAQNTMHGFQLWSNLPASHKMMQPRYRDIHASTIPEIQTPHGASVKIICGSAFGTHGPVHDILTDPLYIDVSVPQGANFELPLHESLNAFAYVIAGDGSFGPSAPAAHNENLLTFGKGAHIAATAGPNGLRFLLAAAKPLNEPIAWRGPIVMNTEQELDTAFREYRDGTFIANAPIEMSFRQEFRGKPF